MHPWTDAPPGRPIVRGLTLTLLALLALAAPSSALSSLVPAPNGGFELGPVGWRLAPGGSVADHDGDLDLEAGFSGCGTNTFQLWRDLTTALYPGTTHLEFTVERGSFGYSGQVYVALANTSDLGPYLDDPPMRDPAWSTDPTRSSTPVLFWVTGWGPLMGYRHLDPIWAGSNIPGWYEMSVGERAAYLANMTQMDFALRGCARSGTTFDNFGPVS